MENGWKIEDGNAHRMGHRGISVNTTALLMRIPEPARVGVRIRDGRIPKTSIARERTAR
jgi:hypothetical protein